MPKPIQMNYVSHVTKEPSKEKLEQNSILRLL